MVPPNSYNASNVPKPLREYCPIVEVYAAFFQFIATHFQNPIIPPQSSQLLSRAVLEL